VIWFTGRGLIRVPEGLGAERTERLVFDLIEGITGTDVLLAAYLFICILLETSVLNFQTWVYANNLIKGKTILYKCVLKFRVNRTQWVKTTLVTLLGTNSSFLFQQLHGISSMWKIPEILFRRYMTYLWTIGDTCNK